MRRPGPFDDLDEVWIWPVPHPEDPEPKDPSHLVTRLGERASGVLVGRVELRTEPGRLLGGYRHSAQGLGPWRDGDVGDLYIPTSDVSLAPARCYLTVDGVRGRWTAGGTFELGDHTEVNHLASRGRPPTAGRSVKQVGANVVAIGRRLARTVRALPPSAEPTSHVGDPVEGPLVAGDGWLVAAQHRTPVDGGHTEAWQVHIDGERARGPLTLGLGLAAVGLVHRPLLVHPGGWRS